MHPPLLKYVSSPPADRPRAAGARSHMATRALGGLRQSHRSRVVGGVGPHAFPPTQRPLRVKRSSAFAICLSC